MSPSVEGKRKAVHIGSAAFALLLRWLGWWQALAIALAALAFNAFVLPRIGGRGLWRADDRARGYARGILLYPAVVAGAILLFRERLALAALLWGLLAFGDGVASIAGALGGPRLPWNRAKTWAGTLGFLLAGGAGAAGLALWTGPSLPLATLLWWLVPTTLLCALVESWDTGLDDNLTVALAGAACLLYVSYVPPDALRASLAGRLHPHWWWLPLLVNLALAGAAHALGTVRWTGVVGGVLFGTLLWTFGGWRVFALLLLVFVLVSAATRLGRRAKEAAGIAEERGGRRGAANAWANGLVPLALAAAMAARPSLALAAGIVGAFAAAAADSCASEVGKVYGRRAYLPTTLRRVEPGTRGAVSLEGTLGGAAAALVVAAVAAALGVTGIAAAALAAAGGIVALLVESVLGSLARERVSGHFLNLLNTALGAAVAAGLVGLLS
jgi:uncharacterized protein (TIGR00297 family)